MLENMKILTRWLLLSCALLTLAHLYAGVQVTSFGAALLASFVLGLFNAVLRPILVVLTLPVTMLTLGLFLFVINAVLFWSAANVLDSFQVTGFGAALLGSLLYSTAGLVIDIALERVFSRAKIAPIKK
jgi:putative membrane protein